MTEQSAFSGKQSSKKAYVGRFAPSPSGPLHFGSLLTALASYLDAKANHGKFLLRIDNIDSPREMAGASDEIIQCMKAFSLHWDGVVIYQSERYPLYVDFLIKLIESNLVYPCECSRKQLADHSQYPGTCRRLLTPPQKKLLIKDLMKDSEQVFSKDNPRTLKPLLSHYSLRLNTQDFAKEKLDFKDEILGNQHYPHNFSDFILIRKDRLPSYMLACAVDDLQDSITHIVRGSDLLESTFWQRCLQYHYQNKSLEMQSITNTIPLHYAHLPVITNELGQKLSKQHHAPAVDKLQVQQTLLTALHALKQGVPETLLNANTNDILSWAIENWAIEKIPGGSIELNSLTP